MTNKRASRAPTRARGSSATDSTPRSDASWLSGWGIALAVGVLVVIAATFVLPQTFARDASSTGVERAKELGVPLGTGVPEGSDVPAFSERDILSGQEITSDSVYDRRTLLFFSEGLMCQACFEQIRDIEQMSGELERRGIRLVSIMPDRTEQLLRAVQKLGLTSPVIADADRSISAAFNTLGLGMHDDTPGHAFVLIDHGKVVWYRDYWLKPYQTMYVPPGALLEDIPQ